MALKFNLDSLEGLDESIAKLYEKNRTANFNLRLKACRRRRTLPD